MVWIEDDGKAFAAQYRKYLEELHMLCLHLKFRGLYLELAAQPGFP